MKTQKTIYLFVFDTLSDWEIGYTTAGINNPMMQLKPDQYTLKTFSIDGKPIRTIGGIKIVPDISMEEVLLSDAKMLILPGGVTWDKGGNKEVAILAKQFHENNISIAAICGATLGLAKAGLLNTIPHTSNSKEYITYSGYTGSDYYISTQSISDDGIITASGTAPLEFARDIFQELHLYKSTVLSAWYELFKTNTPNAYGNLMHALEN